MRKDQKTRHLYKICCCKLHRTINANMRAKAKCIQLDAWYDSNAELVVRVRRAEVARHQAFLAHPRVVTLTRLGDSATR